MKLKSTVSQLCLALPFVLTGQALAEGKLTVYCSVQNTTCEKMVQTFSKNTTLKQSLFVIAPAQHWQN